MHICLFTDVVIIFVFYNYQINTVNYKYKNG